MKTLFTKMFGCRLPIMGAPMARVSGGKLAFETCRAGGLGFIAAGHLTDETALAKLEREIELFREMSSSSTAAAESSFPLAIGFISFSTFGQDSPGWDLVQQILEQHRPEVVQVFAPAVSGASPSGKFKTSLEMCQSYGCKIVAQVGTVRDGLEALDAGADCLVAQGSEAGGHGLRRDEGNGTLSLTARLARLARDRDNDQKKVPVLAAGGIADGRGLAAALSLGADGAVLGTRLWASEEALGSQEYKKALEEAGSCDDVVRTRVFDTMVNSYTKNVWPVPYDSSGVLRNAMTEAWDDSIPALEAAIQEDTKQNSIVEQFKHAEQAQLPDFGLVYSGQGIGEIDSIQPAYDIVKQVESEAYESFSALQSVMAGTSEDAIEK